VFDYCTVVKLQSYTVCVYMISADGCHIVHSHGGERGSDTDQYDGPGHLAVDDNEFVFVADVKNRRVTLLSPTLHYVRQVVSSDKLKWLPCRLYLDVQRLDPKSIESTDRVDRTSLKSSQSTFNT